MKKRILFSLFFFLIINVFSQKSRSQYVGQTTIEELKVKSYKKDSSAVAVVIYELGNYYADMSRKHTNVTDYYYRIKILKPEGLDKGTLKVTLFNEEKISNIRANSSNLNSEDEIEKKSISNNDIIRNKTNENVEEVIVNIPNTKVGSVIEYSYTITSPYIFIKDWYFQTDIPKIRSEFSSTIPTSREYITRLRGIDTLTLNDSIKISNCITGKLKARKCKSYLYRMDSVKAFKEELFMPNLENFISSLTFKLSYIIGDSGFPVYRTLSNWKEFDNRYKFILEKDKKVDTRFYKRRLPDSILELKSKLEKAKGIYYFVQNHFTWNKYLGGSLSYKLRKKFKSKEGSVNLINSSLFNSLNSAEITCNYVLLSTRGNGIPEKEIPMLEDYNYLIVKATIDGKEYFLDATEKELEFGIVPIRVLNAEARIMDFDKGSYWQKVKPIDISTKNSILDLDFDEEMNLKGKMLIKRSGINAYITRKEFKLLGREKYLDGLEEETLDINIDSFEIKNLEKPENNLTEIQEISIFNEDLNTEVDSDTLIRFSPVFFDQLSINPFKSNKRNFDLDFIYQRKNTYRLSIKIPDNYEVIKLPKDLGLSLPNDGGAYVYKISKNNNKINIYIKFYIKKNLFSIEEYLYLKELYEQIIQAESAYIEFRKVKK